MNCSYFRDAPASEGVKNALERARFIMGIRWMPRQEIRHLAKPDNGGLYQSARSGKKAEDALQYPIPYSSTRIGRKLVGIDVSVETFLSAVENPASVFYTHDLADFDDAFYNCTVSNASLAYGLICSGFASYMLDLPVFRITHEWGNAQEFYEITEQNADALSLCDCLVSVRENGHTGGHVRVVTGLVRDSRKRVCKVEISEWMMPAPRVKWYTAEEINASFLKCGGKERIFRYRYLDSVKPHEPLTAPKNNELMLDYGDQSNYRQGDSVEFNVNCQAETLMIEGAGQKHEIDLRDLKPTLIQGNEYRIYQTADLAPGRYTAWGEKSGIKTEAVHFNVVSLPAVAPTQADGTPFERIAFTPVGEDGKPLTKASACLYQASGELKTETFKILLTDGEHKVEARIAVRERDGELIARPAANFTDADGNSIRAFRIDGKTQLYALRIADRTAVHIAFSGEECCEPLYYSWSEEGWIHYCKRLFCADDLLDGAVDTIAKVHSNDFIHFDMTCVNEFGCITTEPVLFVRV